MLNFVIGNNLSRENHLVDEDATIKSALEEAGVDMTRGTLQLDGATLRPGDINRTFREMGYATPRGDGRPDGFLTAIVKADNAA